VVRFRWIATLALLIAAAPLEAQRVRGQDRPPGDRPALEKRFRERLESVMRQRLALNDEQVRKLQDANGRFEGRRRELFMEERQVRMGLRKAIENDSTASNDEVASLLERAMRLQRQRLDLMESEQKELATFMTPIQRAKYFGLLEQVRRQMDDMRSRREGEGGKVAPSYRPRIRPPG
jgi:hypothetical protein